MADKIHFKSEKEWTSICNLRNRQYRPLRITQDITQVTCEKCLEILKERGIG